MGMDRRQAIRFIAAVPAGFWTAYSDVAAACGSDSPRSVGLWLRGSGDTIPNYWRVLTVKGEVPETFVGGGSGPLDAESARDRLRREGVWVDADGIARQEQRFTIEDWIRLQTGGGLREIRLPNRQTRPAPRQPAKPSRPGELRVGGTVRARDEQSGQTVTWKIVSDAPDRGKGELSARSPVGSALLGHIAREVVVVQTRNGSRTFTIEEIVP